MTSSSAGDRGARRWDLHPGRFLLGDVAGGGEDRGGGRGGCHERFLGVEQAVKAGEFRDIDSGMQGHCPDVGLKVGAASRRPAQGEPLPRL